MRALTVALLCFCATAMAAPLVIDGDADGVDDAVDQCLYSPSGATVDARGCSSQADDDGDGVPDQVDACPYSPAGVRVDLRGCALDEDGDGVADSLDRCPLTASGAEVDASGCANGQQAAARAVEPATLPPAPAPIPARQADQPSLPRVVLKPEPGPITEPALPVTSSVPVEVPPSSVSPMAMETVKLLPPPPAVPMPKAVAAPNVASASKPIASNISPPPPSLAEPTAPKPAVTTAITGVSSAAAAPSAIDNILLRFNYEPQSAQIGSTGLQSLRALLPRLRRELAANARAVLLVRGYADAGSDGTEPDTMARTRANRLRKLLEAEGIDGERLRTLGVASVKSESRPEHRKADLVLASE